MDSLDIIWDILATSIEWEEHAAQISTFVLNI